MFNRNNNNVSLNIDSLKNIFTSSKKAIKTTFLLGAAAAVLSGCGKTQAPEESKIHYVTEDGVESECSSISEIEDKSNVVGVAIEYLSDTEDLEGISEIDGLEDVEIYSPLVDDLSPLTGTRTTSLTIMDASCDDWTFLEGVEGVEDVTVSYTNLEDTSFITSYEDVQYVDLSNNFISSFECDNNNNITELYLKNNSIKDMDLSKFSKLERIELEGNYNLYTAENFNYLNTNNIDVDFDEKDIEYINQIKKDLSELPMTSNTFENENLIIDYVNNKMNYDKKALKSDDLATEYNENILKYFVEGKGVCVNYATGLDACLELSGINSYTIKGLVKNEGHEWNMVEIDGQYYLCDATNTDVSFSQKISQFVINSNPTPYLNAAGESAEKNFEEYKETDPSHELEMVNSHMDAAKNINSAEGMKQDNKNSLYKMIHNGSLILLSGLLFKGIFGEIIREEKYRRQRIKLRKKEQKKALKKEKKERLLEKKRNLEEERNKERLRKKEEKQNEPRIQLDEPQEKNTNTIEQPSINNIDVNISKPVQEVKMFSIDDLIKQAAEEKIREEELSFLDMGYDYKKTSSMTEEEYNDKLNETIDYMRSRIGKSKEEKALMDIKRNIGIMEAYTGRSIDYFKNIDINNINEMSKKEKSVFDAQMRQYDYINSESITEEIELRNNYNSAFEEENVSKKAI